jgi:hypothetical protein
MAFVFTASDIEQKNKFSSNFHGMGRKSKSVKKKGKIRGKLNHKRHLSANPKSDVLQDFQVPGPLMLNSAQESAINYVWTNSAFDKSCESSLTDQLLELCSFACFQAPIAIYVRKETLSKIIDDGYLKNQFEVGSSNGTYSPQTRISWERNMFGDAYKGQHGANRCKYGCLQLTQNRTPSTAYGECWFILKQHVRPRITTCLGDSDGQGGKMKIATLDHFTYLLQDRSIGEINSLLAEVRAGLTKSYSLVELQIHGEVALSRDVESLYLVDHKVSFQESKKLNDLHIDVVPI